jgi:hypothetical protein
MMMSATRTSPAGAPPRAEAPFRAAFAVGVLTAFLATDVPSLEVETD